MRLTFACLLFIVICMTVSARYSYGYGAKNKDKKGWGRSVYSWTRSAYRTAARWTRSTVRVVRFGRWGEKRGLYARQDKPEEIYAEMFKALDEDRDGFVDIDELRDDMATVLQGETRTPMELMVETDTNGDGKVDFEEFVNDIRSDNP